MPDAGPPQIGARAPLATALRRDEMLWLAAAVLLAGLTLLVFRGMERYAEQPSSLLADPAFAALEAMGSAAGGVGGWEVEGAPARVAARDGTVRLQLDDAAAGTGVRQLIRLGPGDPHDFRLEAVVASERIKGERRNYNVGEVTLVADERIARAPHNIVHRLAGFRGTRGPERVMRTFHFPAATREVELAIRLRYATGTLAVRGLRMTGLLERPAFTHAAWALKGAWAVMLAVGALLFWRRIEDRRSGVALALAAVTGLGVLVLPERWREAILDPLAALIPGVFARTETLADIGHFIVFVVLGCLVRVSRPHASLVQLLALLIAVAGLAELLQYLAELRAPSLHDWLINAAGAVCGVAAACGVAGLRRLRRRPQPGPPLTVPPQATKQAR